MFKNSGLKLKGAHNLSGFKNKSNFNYKQTSHSSLCYYYYLLLVYTMSLCHHFCSEMIKFLVRFRFKLNYFYAMKTQSLPLTPPVLVFIMVFFVPQQKAESKKVNP